MKILQKLLTMREIKFRGRKSNGEWIYGDLVHNVGVGASTALIFPEEAHDSWDRYIVLTDTIGQFTGLHDKNGKEVYEGDIVSFTADKQSKNWVRPIKWIGAGFIFGDIFPLNYPSGCYDIIGNIYDNPELLNK